MNIYMERGSGDETKHETTSTRGIRYICIPIPVVYYLPVWARYRQLISGLDHGILDWTNGLTFELEC